MNCQQCECSLDGLHAYGKTLDENYCCICWFAILDEDVQERTVVSALHEECEECGIDLLGDENAGDIAAIVEKKLLDMDNEIDDLQRKIRRLGDRQYRLERLKERAEKSGMKAQVAL